MAQHEHETVHLLVLNAFKVMPGEPKVIVYTMHGVIEVDQKSDKFTWMKYVDHRFEMHKLKEKHQLLLSGKDLEIENLKKQIEGMKNEKDQKAN